MLQTAEQEFLFPTFFLHPDESLRTIGRVTPTRVRTANSPPLSDIVFAGSSMQRKSETPSTATAGGNRSSRRAGSLVYSGGAGKKGPIGISDFKIQCSGYPSRWGAGGRSLEACNLPRQLAGISGAAVKLAWV